MFIDFHNDTILKILYENADFVYGSERLHIDLPKLKAIPQVKALFFAVCCDPVFEGEDNYRQTILMIEKLKAVLNTTNGYIHHAMSAREVRGCIEGGRVAAVVSVEGGLSINDDMEKLEELYRRGVRLMTLAHWKAVDWVGSAHESDNRGLGEFGRRVVKRMNELGMIIDVAHVSERSILEVAELSVHPIVCSHGSARSVYASTRSLSDEAIKAIAGTGGVVGITFFPPDLAYNPHEDKEAFAKIMEKLDMIKSDHDLMPHAKAMQNHNVLDVDYIPPKIIPGCRAVIDHMRYIVDLVGEECVALGSDYDGVPYVCDGIQDVSRLEDLSHAMIESGFGRTTV